MHGLICWGLVTSHWKDGGLGGWDVQFQIAFRMSTAALHH